LRESEPAALSEAAALYRLMAWMSPAYPLGAFSYSHGLEYAVEIGMVEDRDSLVLWIETVLDAGAGRIDGALFAHAWQAAAAGDQPALRDLAETAAAWRATAETAQENQLQGAAFLATTRRAWPHPRLDDFAAQWAGPVALPIAAALASAVHGVPLAAALAAYLQAFAANLVSAGLRLIPLGQTDGQRAIAALEPAVAAATAAALTGRLDAIGSATPLLDWCSMRHETQYTRLFRS
jgi:urease accessory protein